MDQLDRLKQIAADPGSYGDSIRIRNLTTGGAEIIKEDNTGSIVLDEDQCERAALILGGHAEALRDQVAARLVDHWTEEAGRRANVWATIVLLGFGFIIGLVIGFWAG